MLLSKLTCLYTHSLGLDSIKNTEPVLINTVVMAPTSDGVVSYDAYPSLNNERQSLCSIQNKYKSYFPSLAFKWFPSRRNDPKNGCMVHRITGCGVCEYIQPPTCSRDIHKLMRRRFRHAHTNNLKNRDYADEIVVYFFDC
jgi:hypothetical protein